MLFRLLLNPNRAFATRSIFQNHKMAHKLCMIPGPIEFHEDVLSAMSTPSTSHVDPTFINAFGESLELLRKVVLSKDAQPFVLSGSGTLAWDAVITNLVESGEDLLQVNTGYFGDHFGECAEAYGVKVTHVRPDMLGGVPTMESIEAALKFKSFKLINITQVDTSTGVLTNVKEISALVKKVSPQTLISVDGVCSVGGEELRMEEWGIDAIMTASQKALGTPSGLCVMLASQRALQVLKSRKTPVLNYFANWNHWLPIMTNYEARKPSYFATPAVNLIFALHISLKQILAPGMESRFEAHKKASKKVKDKIESLGLKLVPLSRDIAANTMTAIYYPDGILPTDILPKITQQGVVVAGGLHPAMATKYFRIGHMGISAVETARGHVEKVLEAVETGFKQAQPK